MFNMIKYSIDMSFMDGYLESINAGDSIRMETEVFTKEIDCPGYSENLLKTMFSFFIPMIICTSHLVSFLLTVSSIIIEKETKVKVK